RMKTELVEYVAHVPIHRATRDHEQLGDLRIGQASANQGCDLPFPRAEQASTGGRRTFHRTNQPAYFESFLDRLLRRQRAPRDPGLAERGLPQRLPRQRQGASMDGAVDWLYCRSIHVSDRLCGAEQPGRAVCAPARRRDLSEALEAFGEPPAVSDLF